MIRKLLLIILILLLVQVLYSQTVKFRQGDMKGSLHGGISWLFQDDLRNINRDTRKMLPFLTQTIDDFPPYLSYGGQVILLMSPRFGLGTSYHYYTTGSRIGAKDYSATYSFDQIISAHSPGLVFEYVLADRVEWRALAELTGGAHLASWKMKERMVMGSESEGDEYRLTAFRPYLFPALKAEYPFGKMWFAGLKLGYSFDLGGKYQLVNHPSGNSELEASFSGVRGLLTLGMFFR
jgi:hypothetical protein